MSETKTPSMVRITSGTMDPITLKCPESYNQYTLKKLLDIVSKTFSKNNDDVKATTLKNLTTRSIVHDSKQIGLDMLVGDLNFVNTPTNAGTVRIAELHFQQAASGGF